MFCARGLYGAIRGARMAMRTTTAMTIMPNNAPLFFATKRRIEVAFLNLDEEVVAVKGVILLLFHTESWGRCMRTVCPRLN